MLRARCHYATAAVLLAFIGAGCADTDESVPELGSAAGPLVISNDDDTLRFDAPQGEYNMFGIYAVYDTAECGSIVEVYGVTGPAGVRIEDCPDCVLPGSVEVGRPIDGFDVFACLPGSASCEYTDEIQGLTLADLAGPTLLCDELVTPASFVIRYEHLDTTEPEAPRTWITATAEFRLDAAGTLEVLSDWVHCVIDEGDEVCEG